MWFLPSYGRPNSILKLLGAPGGMPGELVIVVNMDDPAFPAYVEVLKEVNSKPGLAWKIMAIPQGRVCDAWRSVFKKFPDEAFYGLMSDDCWPLTPGWHAQLGEAAQPCFFSVPQGAPQFPQFRNAGAIGGDLIRAMGLLVPPGFKHNYADDVWCSIAKDFQLLKPMPDIVVQHLHPLFGTGEQDATYVRGSSDIEDDRKTFVAWMRGPERVAMSERIAAFLSKGGNGHVTAVDLRTKKLAILVPHGDYAMDMEFHGCLTRTMQLAAVRGLDTKLIECGGGSNIAKAREHLLWRAYYEYEECTNYIYIDNDMTFDPKLPLHLLATGHDFCGIVGVKKQDELGLCCNFLEGHQRFHPVTNFMYVREIGGAFMMLKRETITRMAAAYPELEYRTASGRREYALFLEMLEDYGKGGLPERLSEDFSFCNRWRKIGGDILIDHNAALGHIGRKTYTGKVADILEITEIKPEERQAAE